MDKELFDYKECIRKENKILGRYKSKLPKINGKNDALVRINNYIKEFKLPVLYRYMPVSINALVSIINEDVFMVPAAKMNDVFEGAPYGILSSNSDDYNEIARIQNEIYVKAFSCEINNTLMWSHYGDSHAGICIGYDFSKAPENVMNHLYPVQYSDVRFSAEYSDNIASHPFLYLRKSKCWQYEKEFRLLYTKNELLNGRQDINLGCIAEIQFGQRIKPEHKQLIQEIVKRKRKSIKLYKTKLIHNSFELEREEICRD